ncbi:precorrin-3B synthase [Paracoccus sp. M683]|uniref:precorrin-3B synthase n=1 Tax=Paracoccus sp. M683 TaxID=2594268 RepID=UPI001181151D|nr:precorrin-3B synthase [Paracoccus sp. M683]TRW96542.1 precorrin-3B synthase [Paracoccus sp. M683]
MSVVKGWCPGALQPMESGDGWVVRVRPRGGRLSMAQAAGIAQAAEHHGNGLIDLTGRANLQLRGVTPATHAPLITDLRRLDLIDADIATETRRNIIVTPFADIETDRLATTLEAALAVSTLTLPAKFGFAVDTGPAPVLTQTPADIRIERAADGHLLLRADGMATGQPLTDMACALDLAAWFLSRGVTDGRGRMAALIARGTTPPASLSPAVAAPIPGPGPVPQGMLVALEFGQAGAATLTALAALGPIRLTPWRMLLIEGLHAAPDLPGLILDPADPRLRLRACTGAPGCPQAHAATRPLARSLAAQVPKGAVLHVSGCAKGCGWPHPATVTLTATSQGFDLIRGGRAHDIPQLRGLPAARLPEVL